MVVTRGYLHPPPPPSSTVPLHSPTMKLLLLLAALTTTTLAKPYFSGSTTTPDPNADNEALCTLLFYPLEGWFSICPQSVRADGSAVPKPDLEGWQKLEEGEKLEKLKLKGWKKLEDAEELEELKLKLNEMATMKCESWFC